MLQFLERQRPLNAGQQPLLLGRLDKIVKGSRLDALDRRLHLVQTADDDDRDFRVLFDDLRQQLLAGDVRHYHVEQNQADFLLGKNIKNIPAVITKDDVINAERTLESD